MVILWGTAFILSKEGGECRRLVAPVHLARALNEAFGTAYSYLQVTNSSTSSLRLSTTWYGMDVNWYGYRKCPMFLFKIVL